MGACSIAEAKDKLSSLVKQAEEGEDVAITRHGKAVAHFASDRRTRASATQPRTVSDFANLEVGAALSRCLRVGRLTQGQVESALLDFDAIRANCRPLTHRATDFLLAERLVRDFAAKLAAADSLRLASAKNSGVAPATLDVRLAEAARGQGVDVADLG